MYDMTSEKKRYGLHLTRPQDQMMSCKNFFEK